MVGGAPGITYAIVPYTTGAETLSINITINILTMINHDDLIARTKPRPKEWTIALTSTFT